MRLSVIDLIAYALIAAFAVFTISEFASAETREPAKAFWTESPPSEACMPSKPKPRKHVKRKPKPAPQPQVVEKRVEVEVVKEVVVEKYVEAPTRRNRVELLVGAAPYMGGELLKFSTKVTLSNNNYLPAAGLSFSRTFSPTSRWSWGAEVFTNLSGFAKIGYGF